MRDRTLIVGQIKSDEDQSVDGMMIETGTEKTTFDLNAPLTANLRLSMITTAAGFLSGTVLIAMLGHFLPVETFGEITYGFTVASLAQVIPTYGFQLLVVREISQKRLSPDKTVINLIIAQLFLSLITFLASYLFIVLTQVPPELIGVISIFVTFGILGAFSTVISAVNKGLNDFSIETKVAVVRSLLICVLVPLTIVLFSREAEIVGLAAVGSNLGGVLVALILVRPNIKMNTSAMDLRQIVALLRSGFPFALHLILGTLYFQVDTLIIGNLLGLEQVGMYQAATRLVSAALPLSVIVNNVYLPRLSNSFITETGENFSSEQRKLILIMGALGISTTVFFVVLSHPLIATIYGEKLAASVPILQIFSLVLLFRFVASGYGILLIASQRQIVMVWTAAAMTVLNLSLNLIFIPRFGISASAWIGVLTNLSILIIYIMAFHHWKVGVDSD